MVHKMWVQFIKNKIEGACGHRAVKGRHQEKEIYCESAYEHVAL
jgi:hypothetical protein